MTHRDLLIWAIAVIATAGVIIRPWKLPEAVWAVSGAALLVLLGLMPLSAAIRAAGKGTDVYLFLTGMMLLSEIARREGLFDWLAGFAARRARGSPRRLFLLVYAVGTIVTAFLSNDATAVVLTPAVFAVTRAVRAENPLPYLFACAFIANAASFVLPISNPANLVLYASITPPLFTWLRHFGLASALSILATYVALRLSQCRALDQEIAAEIAQPALSNGGRGAAIGIVITAIVLLIASTIHARLGFPTAICGAATAILVLALKREAPWPVLRGVSWAVLPLVAGLFVLVEALDETGLIIRLAEGLRHAVWASPGGTAWGAGAGL
ncbi:MAG TPA: SLC13 family permease, partial [Acetobacteraceae bacterium]|nr:SLC13 family permease [Acetobacteraceae bacterium]